MEFTTLTFYKYTNIKDLQKLKNYLLALCEEHSVLGRILIATEGINGGISGKNEAIELFKNTLKEHSLFHDLTFREQPCQEQAYHKLVVRTRK